MDEQVLNFLIEVQKNSERKIAKGFNNKFVILTSLNKIIDKLAELWDINPNKLNVDLLTTHNLGKDIATVEDLTTNINTLEDDVNNAVIRFSTNKDHQENNVYVGVNLKRLLGLMAGHENVNDYILQGNLLTQCENLEDGHIYNITDNCQSIEIPMVFAANELELKKGTAIDHVDVIDAIISTNRQSEFNFDYFPQSK